MINFAPINYEQLGTIIVNGQNFSGIGYKGLLTLNEKSYIENPERSNDGSMPNLADQDTITVPQLKVIFRFMNISDYQRFKVATRPNEFSVSYFDKEFGYQVTHLMYIKPETMTDIYNTQTLVQGVLEFTAEFVATLNDMSTYVVKYYANGGNIVNYQGSYSASATYSLGHRVIYSGLYYEYKNANSSSGHIPNETNSLYWKPMDSLNGQSVLWGNSHSILSANGLLVKSGYNFVKWSTNANGTGNIYYANQNTSIFETTDLYAVWVAQ